MEYVVGLLFNDEETQVVLVRKNRPPWQAGYLNGVGGKINFGERPERAMVREFEEETGLHEVAYSGWIHTVTLSGPGFRVFFYMSHTESCSQDLEPNRTDEPIEIHRVDQLQSLPVVPNLRWIIPLSLNQHISGPMTGTVFPVEVFEERRG